MKCGNHQKKKILKEIYDKIFKQNENNEEVRENSYKKISEKPTRHSENDYDNDDITSTDYFQQNEKAFFDPLQLDQIPINNQSYGSLIFINQVPKIISYLKHNELILSVETKDLK